MMNLFIKFMNISTLMNSLKVGIIFSRAEKNLINDKNYELLHVKALQIKITLNLR